MLPRFSRSAILLCASIVAGWGTAAPAARPTQRGGIIVNDAKPNTTAKPAAKAPEAKAPEPMREFRGVWVATVGNIDWPSKKGLPTDQQQKEIIAILDRTKELNLNAVVFQVRPSADALYDSKIEPWSEYLTGEQGKAPEPYYDPLQMWVEEAHKRGLELHVWFNPYRAKAGPSAGGVADNYIGKTHPEVVKDYGKNQQWMDPGEKLVQDQSLAVMMDVVKRYDIDGVHMDDYFYPYKVKAPNGKDDLDFPDEPSWQKYVASGGKLNRNDWRRHNVDTFVEKLYQQIKDAKPWVKLGISPFGIWQPGYPPQIKGFNQYESLYADAKKWINEGWVDYFTPQLYWRISSPGQSYPVLLKWWLEQNTHDRHIWPGLFTSKINGEANGFNVDEIINQVVITRFLGANGNVHFSMRPFMTNKYKLNDMLTGKDGIYAQPALVPASPWLGMEVPGKPKLEISSQAAEDTTSTAKSAEGNSAADAATTSTATSAGDASSSATATATSDSASTSTETAETKPARPAAETTPTVKLATVTWTGSGPKAWQWAVFTRQADAWTMHVLPGDASSYDIMGEAGSKGPAEVAVMGLDRNCNEGPLARLKLGADAAASKPKESYGQVQ
jgi:uncharacterized lipoprotein YddW (UPF0748 family)